MSDTRLAISAAYQVGLTYLSTGMRRAVSACTSPEVFFGRAAVLGDGPVTASVTTDPLGLAMENMTLGGDAQSQLQGDERTPPPQYSSGPGVLPA